MHERSIVTSCSCQVSHAGETHTQLEKSTSRTVATTYNFIRHHHSLLLIQDSDRGNDKFTIVNKEAEHQVSKSVFLMYQKCF